MSGDPLVVACQRTRHVIEVIVFADDHSPLADECVEVRVGSNIMRSKTDSQGWCRFEGLEAGCVELSLYKLDGQAWEKVDAVPLPPDSLDSVASANWQADPNAPPAHIPARILRVANDVSRGAIAVANGFTPSQVDDDIELQAQQLSGAATASSAPLLALPARQRRWESVPVDQRHYLHRIGVPFSLTIRLLDAVGKPRRALPYLLRLSNQGGTVTRSLDGKTDLDGFLVESIAPDSADGELLVVDVNGPERYPLRLVGLDPVASIAGLQQRLNNLGYWCGDPDGVAGEATEKALAAFQRRCGLAACGGADERTRALLLAMHCS